MVKSPFWENTPGALEALINGGQFEQADLVSLAFRPQLTGPLLLDIVPGEGAGYSTRKIRRQYNGPCLRVWRSSDNHQLDIGFVNDELDTVTMVAFCGVGAGVTGRMTVWYDQGVNGRDLGVNAGAFNLGPRLVTSGAVSATINGKCAPLSVGGSSDVFMFHSTLYPWFTMTTGSVMAVGNAFTGGSANTVFPPDNNPMLWAGSGTGGSSNSNYGRMEFVSSVYPGAPAMFTRRYPAAWFDSPPAIDTVVPYTFGTDQIFTMRFNTADVVPNKSYVAGGTPGANASTHANIDTNGSLSVIGAGSGQFDGKVSEFVIYSRELSLNDTNIAGSIQSLYWGPTWRRIFT